MILLRDLLREITFGGVTPYVTQFTWKRIGGNDWLESQFAADGQDITFAFTRLHRNDWGFAIITRDTRNPDLGNWTVSHKHSAATGQVNYIRLMRTAAEAIRDFATQWAPEAIDVTGSDTSSDAKDLQKTRIYRTLLDANASELASIGYVLKSYMGKLWLVRKSTADATGIEND